MEVVSYQGNPQVRNPPPVKDKKGKGAPILVTGLERPRTRIALGLEPSTLGSEAAAPVRRAPPARAPHTTSPDSGPYTVKSSGDAGFVVGGAALAGIIVPLLLPAGEDLDPSMLPYEGGKR
jgi:hypothetical protein